METEKVILWNSENENRD